MSDRSVLGTDFSELRKRNELWLKNREYRENIYSAVGKYIEFLEKLLLEEKNENEKFLIEKRIKKLKKEQEKYYVPCILAMPIERNNFDVEEKEQNKGRSLIKRLFNKKI